jgi:hypothetical protein
MTSNFTMRLKKIASVTIAKSALWELEYAPGVFTNFYAADRTEAELRSSAIQGTLS